MDQPKKKAVVAVLGCKVNQAEAAAMGQILAENGYMVDEQAEDPELVVINTCCVTQKAEGKSRRMVGRMARKFPRARLVVTGCLAEVNPESIDGMSHTQVCLGRKEKDRFRDFVKSNTDESERILHSHEGDARDFSDLGSTGIPGRARAFLKVQDGCSQVCSYCIVPRARGPSRSLPWEKAVEDAARLESQGFGEIVLTGIHLGHYGHDLYTDFGLEDLLERLLDQCSQTRFRLSSVEPQEISERLIDLVTHQPGLCRHFHIPVQSGDDEILRRMKRPYDSRLVRELFKSILQADPGTCIGLDVMVGFPGESEESFRKTGHLLQQSGAAYLHVFPYSTRPGTVAATYDQRVHESVATCRVDELRALSMDLRNTFQKKFLGQTLMAVPESDVQSGSEGIKVRTDNYILVEVPAGTPPPGGQSFPVRLERMEGDRIIGTVADCASDNLDSVP